MIKPQVKLCFLVIHKWCKASFFDHRENSNATLKKNTLFSIQSKVDNFIKLASAACRCLLYQSVHQESPWSVSHASSVLNTTPNTWTSPPSAVYCHLLATSTGLGLWRDIALNTPDCKEDWWQHATLSKTNTRRHFRRGVFSSKFPRGPDFSNKPTKDVAYFKEISRKCKKGYTVLIRL